jgi:rubrerythrin
MRFTAVRAVLAAALITASAVSASTGEDLGEPTREALLRALDDERHAKAIYQTVLNRHGEVKPFSNIRSAEERHESHLLDLFEEYEMDPPVDPWPQQEIEIPETLSEACAQAVEAEKANIAMYDELLESVENPEVRDIFERLRNASEERHLPAFDRCGGGGRGLR